MITFKKFNQRLEEQLTSKKLDTGGHAVFYKGTQIGTVHVKKVPFIRGKTITKITAKYHTGEEVSVKSSDTGRNTVDSAKQSLLDHHLEKIK
jgi:hypothetical protein